MYNLIICNIQKFRNLCFSLKSCLTNANSVIKEKEPDLLQKSLSIKKCLFLGF